ncbi:Nnf1-domain-containing protein [Coniochaeta ligniaria NRRL 30616]|uniref:Nnf1-domain-containing protein n=1 Tax=Coniochaeta ligniaria NRRL 30616 TaxID=1408157 RepID=A0A1J7JV10_9PEZI|nr:Nnf1-domain-containing protein [Coniochaeta ligniaria NRRL 30616]
MATDTPSQPSDPPLPPSTTTTSTTTPSAPASPPLPLPPIALAPGPRASRLQEVFADRLKHTLAKLSYPNIASCYPTIAAKQPSTLKSIQAQMVAILEARAAREFETVMRDRDVVRKLNELEDLVAVAGQRRGEGEMDGRGAPTPPHLLPPEQILAAHLAPHLAGQQSQLNARLQTMQSHNVALFEEIRAQREEAARLLAAVDKVLADVDGANALLDEVVGELATETREVEVEMAGT